MIEKLKDKKAREDKLYSILIDFGNHYLKATQGSRLRIKQSISLIEIIIENEKKKAYLDAILDAKTFIEEIGLTEDLLPVFKETIKDLLEEIAMF